MGEGLKEVWSVSVEVWEVCSVGCSDAERSWEHQQVSVTIPFPSPGGPPLRGTVSYYNSAVFNFTSMESYGCFVSAVYSIGTHFL